MKKTARTPIRAGHFLSAPFFLTLCAAVALCATVGAAWATEGAGSDQAGSAGGFLAVLLQSLLILVREGFEAMLVIVALVAWLRRTNPDKIWVIGHGVVWALVASVLTAWLTTSIYRLSGEGQEALEGATMLLAAAVLFYVSFWLISKREAARWQHYIQRQVDQALSRGSLWGLGLAAFFAVYREGAETVLFYQALLLGAPQQETAIIVGFALAALLLAAIYLLLRNASLKLPIGLFFAVTAVFLYALAFTFVGRGVHELQEAHWIPLTALEWMPRIRWAGIYPSVESLAAQFCFLLPLPVAWRLLRRRPPLSVDARDDRK